MTITSFVWRPRAKFVAVVDLIFSAISIVWVIIIAILAAVAVAVVNFVVKVNNKSGAAGGSGDAGGVPTENTDTVAKPEVVTIALWILWVGVVFDCGMTVLQVWASFKLLKSTEIRKTPTEALSGARFWLYLTFILMLIRTPLDMVVFGMFILGGIKLVITIACLFVVFQYTDELKVAINTQTISRVAPL